jgi:hypothetical protein
MAVKTLFPVTQILPECVSRQSHCSNIRMAAKMAATDSIIISYHEGLDDSEHLGGNPSRRATRRQ